MKQENPTVLQRYLHKPFIGSSHAWAMNHLEALETSASILDVGCGSGFVGQHLGERGFSQIDAVEVDDAARKQAEQWYNKTYPSLDNVSTTTYDCIVILDVLEHVTSPFKMFQQCCSLLKPGGKILVSVPNIAHWSTRFSLLFGKFDYTDRGILDKTHFQFFTRKRFKQLLSCDAESSIAELASSIEPVELLAPKVVWDNTLWQKLSTARREFANFWPGLWAYQHLGIAQKKS